MQVNIDKISIPNDYVIIEISTQNDFIAIKKTLQKSLLNVNIFAGKKNDNTKTVVLYMFDTNQRIAYTHTKKIIRGPKLAN